jgi:hypothetical protein
MMAFSSLPPWSVMSFAEMETEPVRLKIAGSRALSPVEFEVGFVAAVGDEADAEAGAAATGVFGVFGVAAVRVSRWTGG